MKIRTDFVTNSSSACYTLALRLVSEAGAVAGAAFSVSSDGAWTPDGFKTGGDICFTGSFADIGKMILENKDINELINALCSNIEIIRFDDEEDFDEECDSEDTQIVCESGVTGDGANFPNTIRGFKEEAKEIGIMTNQIRYIVTQNIKYGDGDSAMWIEMDIFDPYRARYADAKSKEEKSAVIEEAVQYILTGPKWEINDNDGEIVEPLPVLWSGNVNSLRSAIRDALDGKGNHGSVCYWMGSRAHILEYDVKTGKKKTKTVFYTAAD